MLSSMHLFEYIPSGIMGNILKSLTFSGAKNNNKIHVPSQLVTWIPYTVFIKSKSMKIMSDMYWCEVLYQFWFSISDVTRP